MQCKINLFLQYDICASCYYLQIPILMACYQPTIMCKGFSFCGVTFYGQEVTRLKITNVPHRIKSENEISILVSAWLQQMIRPKETVLLVALTQMAKLTFWAASCKVKLGLSIFFTSLPHHVQIRVIRISFAILIIVKCSGSEWQTDLRIGLRHVNTLRIT